MPELDVGTALIGVSVPVVALGMRLWFRLVVTIGNASQDYRR